MALVLLHAVRAHFIPIIFQVPGFGDSHALVRQVEHFLPPPREAQLVCGEREARRERHARADCA